MSKFNFYEITSSFPRLMEAEDISEEEKKQIEDELSLLLKEKSANIIGYTRNIELTIEAMKTEEKRMSENRKALENKLKKFKEYVKNCMEENSIGKIETSLGTLSICKSPFSVEILDKEVLPSKYKKVVQQVEVDKNALKEDFKATGELVDGVKYNLENTYLKIK